MAQKARALDAVYKQNHGAVPHYSKNSGGTATTYDVGDKTGGSGFHGANSVKVTSYEEKALRNMKAFWLP